MTLLRRVAQCKIANRIQNDSQKCTKQFNQILLWLEKSHSKSGYYLYLFH